MECWFAAITGGSLNWIVGIEQVIWGPGPQSDHIVSPVEWRLVHQYYPKDPSGLLDTTSP